MSTFKVTLFRNDDGKKLTTRILNITRNAYRSDVVQSHIDELVTDTMNDTGLGRSQIGYECVQIA